MRAPTPTTPPARRAVTASQRRRSRTRRVRPCAGPPTVSPDRARRRRHRPRRQWVTIRLGRRRHQPSRSTAAAARARPRVRSNIETASMRATSCRIGRAGQGRLRVPTVRSSPGGAGRRPAQLPGASQVRASGTVEPLRWPCTAAVRPRRPGWTRRRRACRLRAGPPRGHRADTASEAALADSEAIRHDRAADLLRTRLTPTTPPSAAPARR